MNNYIDECKSYILNDNNIFNYLKYKLIINKNNIIKNNNNNNNNNNNKTKFDKQYFFVPNEKDTLFWCYYIIKNGDIKYETINNKNLIITKQIKIDYVTKIRENKQIVKKTKFDSIINIESNLANDDYINIKTIMTLSVIDNINIIFITKKTYFECLNNVSDNIYIIRELEYNKKYGYEIANDENLNKIRTTLYKIESLNKPIKNISFYKVKDLIDICNKLEINIKNDNGKNKTKNELYNSITYSIK